MPSLAEVRSSRGPAHWRETQEAKPREWQRLTGEPDGKLAAAPGPASSFPEPSSGLMWKKKHPAAAQGFSEPVMVLKHFWVMGLF